MVCLAGHDFKDFHETSTEAQQAVLECCVRVSTLLQQVPQVSAAESVCASCPPLCSSSYSLAFWSCSYIPYTVFALFSILSLVPMFTLLSPFFAPVLPLSLIVLVVTMRSTEFKTSRSILMLIL